MPENFCVVANHAEEHWISQLKEALRDYGELRVISDEEARSSRTFYTQEVFIIDGSLRDSLGLVGRCHDESPKSRIYMAAATPDWRFIRGALRAGANRVLEKHKLEKREIVRTVIEPTILFADNKPKFRETRARYLNDAGYNVVMAGSPEEARSHLSLEVDLAILDIRLRDDRDEMDHSGLEVAGAVKGGIPIIFLTNYPAPELVNRALSRGRDRQALAEEFFDKREKPEELLKAVTRLLTVSRDRRKAASAASGEVLENRQVVREMLEAEFEKLVRGPVLDNFEGFVCARINQSGASGEIAVWVQADTPEPEVLSDAIHIHDGQDSPAVTFEIQVESEDLRCLRRRDSLVVEPGKTSRQLTFPFDRPLVPGSQDIWVQVFQKNRLIQVLSAKVELAGEGDQE